MRRNIETITILDEALARAIINGVEGAHGPRGGSYECTIEEVTDNNNMVIATKIHFTEVGFTI